MWFLDSSAIVKLVVEEAESEMLRQFLSGSTFVASEIARTEVLRAVARRDPNRLDLAREILRAAHSLAVTPEALDVAAHLLPPILRSLDAIHLASALTLGNELQAFVAYDERLLASASALGMPVAAPGWGSR